MNARVGDWLETKALVVLDRAPTRAVATVAPHLAQRAEIKTEPGWRFDFGAQDPSRRTRLRRHVWNIYRERQLTDPITLTWYDGIRLNVFLGNDMSLCLYVGGSFEPNEFVFLDTVLEPGMTFIDGGANDGMYSLFAGRRVGSNGKVVAVEPSSREYDRLCRNLALNPDVHIRAVRAALGATPGEARLAIAEGGHEGQNTIGDTVSNPKVATDRHELVELTTIDALVEREALARVDVMKLDVEGSEVAALQGAARTVARFRPIIQIEMESERLASQGHTKDDLRAELARHDYSLTVFDAATGRLRRATGADEPEGNAVAIHRDRLASFVS